MKNNEINNQTKDEVIECLGRGPYVSIKLLVVSFSLSVLAVYIVHSVSRNIGYDIGHAEGFNRGVDSILDRIKAEQENQNNGLI